jgi:zinc protease
MGPPAADKSSSAGLEQIMRGADVFAGLFMKQKYSLLMMVGEENIGGHNTDRVDGFLPNGNPDHLYFDKDSGLLQRIASVSTIARGDTTTTTDFDDYRGVEGIKYPFILRITNSDEKLHTEVHIDKVELNVPVDEKQFARPTPTASSKPAQR